METDQDIVWETKRKIVPTYPKTISAIDFVFWQIALLRPNSTYCWMFFVSGEPSICGFLLDAWQRSWNLEDWDWKCIQELFVCRKFGCNVCGEGGEYETFTLDCPLFRNARIILDGWNFVLHSPDTFAPVGVLIPSDFHLESKHEGSFSSAKVILHPRNFKEILPD